jgi:hypothetical protein
VLLLERLDDRADRVDRGVARGGAVRRGRAAVALAAAAAAARRRGLLLLDGDAPQPLHALQQLRHALPQRRLGGALGRARVVARQQAQQLGGQLLVLHVRPEGLGVGKLPPVKLPHLGRGGGCGGGGGAWGGGVGGSTFRAGLPAASAARVASSLWPPR